MTNETGMGTAGTSLFNLGPRLTLTFSVLIVLILGGNALVISQFYVTRNETDRLTGANQQLIAVLGLQANLLSFHRRLDDLARLTDVRRFETEAASLRGALQEQAQQTRTAIAKLPSGTVVDPSFLPTLDTIGVTLPAEIEAILDLAKSGDWGAIQPRVSNELTPIETQTAILVNSINQQASGELARGVVKMSSVERRVLIIVPATALATFFIAAFFGWSFARRLIELRLDERVAERIRIARELHDTMLQSFQGILLLFYAVSQELQPGETREKLESVINRAGEALNEGRNAIQGLRASTIERNDLAVAVKALGEGLAAEPANQSRTAFSVAVLGMSRDLHPIVRDEVYRIAGEGVCNAFRHANAERIEVEIIYDERHLRVLVRDDGKGIDAKLLSGDGRERHYGLPGMRERAELIGGRLTVRSKLDAGTEIELSIPAGCAYIAPSAGRRNWFAKKFSGKGI